MIASDFSVKKANRGDECINRGTTNALGGYFLVNWFGRIDLLVGITGGYLLQGWSGRMMMNFTTEVSMLEVLITICAQGLCVGFVWVR